jgi:hypothetical protein
MERASPRLPTTESITMRLASARLVLASSRAPRSRSAGSCRRSPASTRCGHEPGRGDRSSNPRRPSRPYRTVRECTDCRDTHTGPRPRSSTTRVEPPSPRETVAPQRSTLEVPPPPPSPTKQAKPARTRPESSINRGHDGRHVKHHAESDTLPRSRRWGLSICLQGGRKAAARPGPAPCRFGSPPGPDQRGSARRWWGSSSSFGWL